MDTQSEHISVLYPNWEEFKDFKRYIKSLEEKGYGQHGLAKVVIFIGILI